MEINIDGINDIYKMSYNTSLSRGKKRQFVINNTIINCLKKDDEYKNFKFIQEDSLKSLWGKSKTFKVDVGVYDENGLREIILLKAPASNVLQNHINFLNSINSDIDRLSYYKDNVKFKIFNFIPRITPFFTKTEKIKHFETNEAEFITKSGKIFLMDITEIYIIFNINGIENCKNKKEVSDLFNDSIPIEDIKIDINYYRKPKIVNE